MVDVTEVIEDVEGEGEIESVEKVDDTEGVREDDLEVVAKGKEEDSELIKVSVEDVSAPWVEVTVVKPWLLVDAAEEIDKIKEEEVGGTVKVVDVFILAVDCVGVVSVVDFAAASEFIVLLTS